MHTDSNRGRMQCTHSAKSGETELEEEWQDLHQVHPSGLQGTKNDTWEKYYQLKEGIPLKAGTNKWWSLANCFRQKRLLNALNLNANLGQKRLGGVKLHVLLLKNKL